MERAQQKLKLDAMVVQQGRLKDKDKLSREDLLDAVRFGADKVFKSKDSSITDDDIDMILDQGRKKTKEMNEKLQKAEKGDMLDFKIDGGSTSAQTFEGIDYSQKGKDLAQIKAAQAQAELMGILDMGKRERRTVANYNENQLYRQQVAAPTREKKKKETRLPKFLRLPRLEEWQMFDREALQKLQEEEEATFRSLTPDQLQGTSDSAKKENMNEDTENEKADSSTKTKRIVDYNNLPPLLSEEKAKEKVKLLAEGFSDWQRQHFTAFVRASAKYGRSNLTKIAEDVGKPVSLVKDYADSFWDENMGKKRISEYEYEKAVKNIERGEKKLAEIKSLERGTAILISLFDNPWFELEFTHVNSKDKMFTIEEDRHLLCWAHKYGYGQWGAVKMAIRRSQFFRFDYFLKSLSPEALGRRCEQLMRAAGREVEQLERVTREELSITGEEEQTVRLPKFKVIQAKKRAQAFEEYRKEENRLEETIEDIENQIEQIQSRLKILNEFSRETNSHMQLSTGEFPHDLVPVLVNFVAKSGPTGIMTVASDFVNKYNGRVNKRQTSIKIEEIAKKEKRVDEGDSRQVWYIQDDFKHMLDVDTLRYLRKGKNDRHLKKDTFRKRNLRNDSRAGAIGPDEVFIEFPEYDGNEPPKESKKAFTHFCVNTRKEVKNSLDSQTRKDKSKVNQILKKKWFALSSKDKIIWKIWENWDKKRYEHQLDMFEKVNGKSDNLQQSKQNKILHANDMHIPKRKLSPDKTTSVDYLSIPKKKR